MDDINHLKSEDHMEFMMMMDNLPGDFCSSKSDGDINLDLSSLEFSGASGCFSNFLQGPTMAPSSSFQNSPPTILFADGDTLNQPQKQTQPPILSHPSNTRSRWRQSGEFSSTDAFGTSLEKHNSMASMREIIFRIAAMQPIHIDPESVKPPKRRNVKISKDPQSVAARHRRERISERIRILQRLVPGGTKMDTASMLDEAIHYVKFLKSQVHSLEKSALHKATTGIRLPYSISSGGGGGGGGGSGSSYIHLAEAYQNTDHVHNHLHYGMLS